MFEKLKNAFKSFANAVINAFSSAASSVAASVATTTLSEKKLEELKEDLFFKLVEADVAVEVAEAICNAIADHLRNVKLPRFGDKEAVIREEMLKALTRLFEDVPDVDLVEEALRLLEVKRPIVMLFLGPNGYGKTTTIAKLTYLFQRLNRRVVWAASDTFRAGAIEQLEGHAVKLGVKVVKHQYGADPAAVAYDAINHAKAKGIDIVMIDTAGRMHTDINLMNELKKIQRVAEPDFSIFIADALLGNEALEIARHYSKHVKIDGLIVTKVDAYPKGGAILTFLYELKKPIYFLGVGQKYEDLRRFNKEEFFRLLLA